MNRNVQRSRELWAGGIFGLLSVIVIVLYSIGGMEKFDQAVFAWGTTIHTGWLTALFSVITQLGSATVIAILGLAAVILGFLRRDRLEAIFLFGGVILAELLNEGLKVLFARPRPLGYGLEELPASWSFPSGHSMVGTCFYALLVYLAIQVTPIRPVLSKLLASVVILAICFSRIYFGVHYASDVIAGLLLGMTCLYVTKYGYERAVDRFRTYRRPRRIMVSR
ncbi:MAG: phosphatase PAP2 family protein [Clostridia bacterium]